MKMAESCELTRLNKLQHSLANSLNQADICVYPYKAGVDCWVDKIEWSRTSEAVVRSAKVEQLHTRYEGLVDFGAEMQKQISVAKLLNDAGIPTPTVLRSHRSNAPAVEPSWMILEFVEHQEVDQLDVELQYQLGAITRRIHNIQPEPGLPHLSRSASWSSWIAERIVARLEASAAYLEIPDIEVLGHQIAKVAETRSHFANRLLHLDLRPNNLAIQNGKIAAIFDLANSIIGDPFLELARIRGCNLLTDAFLDGYGDRIPPNLTHILDIYELDLAALLVTVSREEFDDPQLHITMRDRTAFLAQKILSRA